MAIENVGPGGVGNNYGVRETVARERYDLTKEYIEEYTDVEGTVVTGNVDPVTGGNRFIESLVRNPDGIIIGNITRDSNGAVTSAAVKFPDGTDGTYTALILSSEFPGAVDSYSVTYGSQTYTQPTVTRDSSGAVTNRPAIVVS